MFIIHFIKSQFVVVLLNAIPVTNQFSFLKIFGMFCNIIKWYKFKFWNITTIKFHLFSKCMLINREINLPRNKLKRLDKLVYNITALNLFSGKLMHSGLCYFGLAFWSHKCSFERRNNIYIELKRRSGIC